MVMYLLLPSIFALIVSRVDWGSLAGLTGKLESGMSTFASYIDAVSAAV